MLKESFIENVRKIVDFYPSVLAQIIPFEKDFTTSEPLDGLEYLPYGSTTMTNICYNRGYTGVFFNDNFKYSEYMKQHPLMLNADVGSMNMFEAIEFFKNNSGQWFCKPDADDKNFTGSVEHSEFWIKMLEDKYRYKDSAGDYGADENFIVTISKPKNILMEYRCFIINGKIVDMSMYRFKGNLQKENLMHENDMLIQAQNIADWWLPHRNVVMDLCLRDDDEVRIVEYNCINSSGFYKNDPVKIIGKLYEDWIMNGN